MRKFFFCLLFAVGAIFPVVAAQKAMPPPQMEASMVLTGEVEVDAQGMVQHYTVDGSEKLTPALRGFVDQNIQRWRFEPFLVDGKPAPMRNRMGLQFVLETQSDGNFKIALRNVSFYPADSKTTDEVASIGMKAPIYPAQASKAGMEAEVYLVLRVGRDGRVADVVVEQVNLKSPAAGYEAERWRKVFGASAAARAREWTFKPPSSGSEAGDEFWSVRVPVDYAFHGNEKYGVWQPYLPGPRQPVPWLTEQDLGSPEALAAGGLYPVGGSKGALRLSTPPAPEG